MTRIAVYQQTVTRLNQYVVHRIPGKGFAEIDTEDFHRAVGLRAEKLRGIERSILRDPAGQIDRVLQVHLSRGTVFPWRSNFPADPDFRSRLKIEPAEHSHSVKRL